MQGEGDVSRAIGDLMGLGAAVSWSLYLILSARFASRYSPVLMTSVTCLAGGLGSLPLALWEGGLARFTALPGSAWLQIGYLALLGSVGAFWLWSRGAQQVGPAKAATFMNLVPIFGLLSSVWLLNEELGATQLAGIALVLAGIWGATLASRSAPPPREARAVSARA
ncbi:putative DMT superfamily transporter inner membrane protein [compost metagenome]